MSFKDLGYEDLEKNDELIEGKMTSPFRQIFILSPTITQR